MRQGQKPKQHMHIRTGDLVEVIAGKYRSRKRRVRRGRVIEARPRERRVVVDGMNISKRAVRQSQRMRQGGIIEMPAPMDVSNVMLVCPSCDKRTRVGSRVRPDGTKVRVCRKCGQDIDE